MSLNKILLNDGAYAEPYAGGAGVALELLLEEYVRKIYINDADLAVYSFGHQWLMIQIIFADLLMTQK